MIDFMITLFAEAIFLKLEAHFEKHFRKCFKKKPQNLTTQVALAQNTPHHGFLTIFHSDQHCASLDDSGRHAVIYSLSDTCVTIPRVQIFKMGGKRILSLKPAYHGDDDDDHEKEVKRESGKKSEKTQPEKDDL